MIHDVVLLGDMVLCGLITPGLYEGLVQWRLDGLDANWDMDFNSPNDAEGGLAWLHFIS